MKLNVPTLTATAQLELIAAGIIHPNFAKNVRVGMKNLVLITTVQTRFDFTPNGAFEMFFVIRVKNKVEIKLQKQDLQTTAIPTTQPIHTED